VTTELTAGVDGASGPVPRGDGPGDDGPIGTGSRGTRVLGALTLAGLVLLAVLALVASPADAELGETVRLMYVHVPVVTAAYLGIVLATVGSVLVLWKRSDWWDLVSASAIEVATVFTALTLITGMIWGRPTWGVFWVWDARLTSTAMLFLLMLGYLAVRRTTDDPAARAKRSAVVGLLLLPNVLIVNRSVEWWRSLHQDPTLITLDPKIDGLQLFTLVFGIAVASVLFVWLLVHRFRLAWLQQRADEADLGIAIAARRAEAVDTGPGPSGRGGGAP
jgi:heme exporter protein C